MLKLMRVGLAVSVAAAPILLASPAWAAHEGTVTVTTSNTGFSAGLSATLQATGNSGQNGSSILHAATGDRQKDLRTCSQGVLRHLVPPQLRPRQIPR